MCRSGMSCRAVVAGLAMLVATRADAQSSGASTLAEQLFAQARELAKANRWAEACPKFEASLKYDPVLGTRLNLAACYERIGKLASAWSLYRQAVELANQAGDARRRDYARKQATLLEPRLPRLVITTPADPPAGLLVTRDGTPIDPAALGVALYVDPGPHEIAAAAPGFVAVAQTVTVAEARTETIVLPALQRPLPPVPRPAQPTAVIPQATLPRDEEAEPGAPSTRRRAGLWVGAGGAVVLGVGLVFGVKASSSYSDAKRLCGADLRCDPVNYDQGKRSISDARSRATISTVLSAAGGVALAAGAIVFLTAPSVRHRAAARLVPLAHDHGVGLALTGGF